MKENVQKGEVLIYNPESDRILTQESSIEFVELIEEETEKFQSDEVPVEIIDDAFRATKALSSSLKTIILINS